MKSRLQLFLVVLYIVFASVQISSGEIPEVISYQGVLTDSIGAPLQGNFGITVNIYSQDEGGAALWSETHTGVNVNKGVFSIMLGSEVAFPPSVDFSVPYWLGVSINGGTELTPRTQFASTATAFTAKRVIDNGVPSGMIGAFATPAAPTGWLECNGQAVSRSTFADLFAAIGIMYGAGDGSTTFNLPDYRGYFLRGWDHGASRDPDRSIRTDRGDGTTGDNVGTIQTNATGLPNSAFSTNSDTHSHTITTRILGSGGAYVSNARGPTVIGNPSTNGDTHNHTIAGGGDNETRPININVMYCIKY